MSEGIPGPTEPMPPEPCFLEPPAPGLRFEARHPGLAGHLAQRVSRRRGDLLGHVQRIYWHLDHGDPRQLFGALADLFIALGAHGAPLRRRLLQLATPALAAEHARFLEQHLDSGLEATLALPDGTWSRLTLATHGALTLVTRQQDRAGFADPLQEARDLMDSGALDDARELLEQALLQDPGQEALHRELLELYRATRDAEHLQAMEQRLATRPHPLKLEWARVRRLVSGTREAS